MAGYRKDSLRGSWVHSHEEDTDVEMVFRPAAYPFPLSRGRMSIELREDGTYVESSPGPVDVPEESKGTWSVEGDQLVLAPEGGASRVWHITSAHDDMLTVSK